MKPKSLILGAALLGLASTGWSQVGQEVTPFSRSYFASASEVILSLANTGNVKLYDAQGLALGESSPNPIPRFSAFFHVGTQFHMNVNNGFGFYTGLGLRNVGMINRLSDSIRVKQRAYAVALPVALKLGNMGRKSYLALGAEAEYFFHYKQKTFVGSGRGDKREKSSQWFSNRVNPFNPSVFIEMNFGRGHYFRFKMYLDSFLNNGVEQSYTVNGTKTIFKTNQSQLFVVSYGRVVSKKKKQ